ncbi:MAG: hypothetical protein ACYCZN_02105 [Candidatus Dormibacteria bacterium]
MSVLTPRLFTGQVAPAPPEPWPYGPEIYPMYEWTVTSPAEILWRRTDHGVRSEIVIHGSEPAPPARPGYPQLEETLAETEMALSRAVRRAVSQRNHERDCAECTGTEAGGARCEAWSHLSRATRTAAREYEAARGRWRAVALAAVDMPESADESKV